MKINKTSVLKAIGLFLICVSLIWSCGIPFQGNHEPPKPAQNPIKLSAEAQTTKTVINNLYRITPQNPETDRYKNDETTHRTQLGNDWITFYHIHTYEEKENLKIRVEENVTGKERCYILTLESHDKTSFLTITQRAK